MVKKVKKIYKSIKKSIKGWIPAQYWRVFARGADVFGRNVAKARMFFVNIKKRWPLDKVEKVKKYLPVRAIRIAFRGVEYIGIAFLLLVVFIGFSPRFDFPGGYRSLVVLSGSMEPAVKTGSVVLIQPRDSYAVNDVVTISKKLGAVDHVTHRIVSVEEEKIVTKGDANNAPDNWELNKGDIEGKVVFSAPYLGYAVNFARSVRGFMLLVILPAVLIILSEFWEIKKEIERSYERKLKKALGSAAAGAKKVKMALLFFVFGFSVLALSSGATVAVMSDTETIPAAIAAGTWGEEDASPDVVINEVMWMGSTESAYDEWIELRNTTDQEIDVGQWEIENARESGDPALMIPASQTIPANGFLLIANWPENNANSALNASVDVVNASISLANKDNGDLVLKDDAGNVIDEAKGDAWPEGYNSGGFKKSMERNDTPGDGTLAGSWHTCLDDGCNDGTFWDNTTDENNYGTPGAANLSEDDPTSPDELSAYAEASADRREAGPTSNDEESKELAGEGDVVDAAVEPTGTGGGQEGSAGGGSDVSSGAVGGVGGNDEADTGDDKNNGDTGNNAGDGGNDNVWLGNEDSDVADVGGAGEGNGSDGDGEGEGGGEADGENGEGDSGSGETESNE